MWSFNQNQNSANNQNSNFGWNVNPNDGGGRNTLFIFYRPAIFNICCLFSYLFYFLLFTGVNLGWNLGAPAAAPYPTMPTMPQPSPSTHYDDGEPGVDEVFRAKDAGAVSFAHYIVKWVS
jgi:hypothetical protein